MQKPAVECSAGSAGAATTTEHHRTGEVAGSDNTAHERRGLAWNSPKEGRTLMLGD